MREPPHLTNNIDSWTVWQGLSTALR